ncbi:alpha-ketoglutarate-dependent dioxygenase FTO isoform X2 [Esox lucius]|uniref:Alpha-ketoglutarate-dependent dioxygenase FTO n=1 Tax=Esox lucius TaxID=8010 RepID=A0AAY5KJA9_ESOLU|nr:alpha-ketoglutarate-dependent dioxygenase FTO isoform X2 [Esox lucius]
MKRSGDSESEKRRKRRRLLQELGDQRIPYLGPSDHGFQKLWESSYSGLALRRSCSLPEELHARVEAALLTLRRKGCFLRDLVRVRDRDVFTAVSRVLLGQPGTTYRYLDTRLFTIPWHTEDQRSTCCDPDLSAACKALWELNCFFCSDVGLRKEEDIFQQCRKELAGATESKLSVEGDTESKDSEESKASEGDSESKQSEEGETESKHSEDWDIESRHSEEEGPSHKQDVVLETESRNSEEEGPSHKQDVVLETQSRHSEEEGQSHQQDTVLEKESSERMRDLESKQIEGGCPTGSKQHSDEKDPGWEHQPAVESSETTTTDPSSLEKPVAEPKSTLSGYHVKEEDEEDEDKRSGKGCSYPNPSSKSCPHPAQFNVTLLNYMDPASMSQLKEEPYYGMGKMAVGWHHDENLVSLSPVAVYSYSCHDNDKGVSSEETPGEKRCWRIGLKVAWDIHTPGLTLPLQSGDCYYMRDDLNRTHQHCVLAGDSARFSSTHRVAECSTGTLDYIQSRIREALTNLRTDPDSGAPSLLSLLPADMQCYEEIHNEVEFEWLRQYWFQGQRYTRFCSWWSRPMEQLENDWRKLELMTQLFLAAVEDEGQEQEGRREMAETLLTALTDRQQHRQTWRDSLVTSSSGADKMHDLVRA